MELFGVEIDSRLLLDYGDILQVSIIITTTNNNTINNIL